MKITNKNQEHSHGGLYLINKTELQLSISSIRKEYPEPTYHLRDCIILSNAPHDNHRITFDFLGDADYYGGACTGFLYPDSKFIGKIRYMVDSNLPPEHIRGIYRITKTRIIIHGEWEGVKGDRSFYKLELSYKKLRKP